MSTEYVVADIEDLPEGTHKVVQAGQREVGIFNIAGRYYALPNHCLHQNGPLCKGAVSGTVEANEKTGWKPTWMRQGKVIVCPWHVAEFDITTGQCLAEPRRRLTTYEVNVVGREIKVLIP